MVKGVGSCCQLARREKADAEPSEPAQTLYLGHTEAGHGAPSQSAKGLHAWPLPASRRQALLARGVEGGGNWWIKVLSAQVAGTRRAKHL